MSNTYEKLVAERNRIKEAGLPGFELNTLSQLMLVAFNNDSNPDEFPEVFYIENVLLSRIMLRDILSRLSIDAEVEFVKSIGAGATFKVTQK